MTKQSTLHTLIDLAAGENDEAARKLGLAIAYAEETETKLALLHTYRNDYASRFQASLAAGLSANGYRNFQLFMEKLDSAIASQQEIVNRALQKISEEQDVWRASRQKHMSYNTLADRASKKARHVETKRDQQLNDEFALRQTSYK